MSGVWGTDDQAAFEPENAVIIVVGAHLDAEREDRPIAYALRERVRARLSRGRDAAVCTDVWYLNNDNLRALPTISIGPPRVNALAAYLADRLPSVFVVDDRCIVQADFEHDEPAASCWGVGTRQTIAAVEVFASRFLDEFMRRHALLADAEG
ncbi:MAG: hypothetical protein JNL50_00810 [Phycisphaerae bacterium]|nr:hypothetical protein [Phycisphaerae bacterium]